MNPKSPGILLSLLFIVLLWVPPPAQAGTPVRRKEAIALAEEYARFRWKPSLANAFHGLD